MGIIKNTIAVFTIAILPGLYAAPGNADCPGPIPELLWTSPSADQVGVALDASVVVLGVSGAPLEVLLNDMPIPAREDFHTVFEPGPLLPDSLYVVTVVFGDEDSTVSTFEFHTATEEDQGTPPLPPTVVAVTNRPMEALDATCHSILSAQDCYDSGQNTFLSASFADSPAAWLVRFRTANGPIGLPTTWPASCGAPIVLTGAGPAALNDACVIARSVGASGAISAPTSLLCPPFDFPSEGDGGQTALDSGVLVESDAGGDSQTEPTCACVQTRYRRGSKLGGTLLVTLLCLIPWRRRREDATHPLP
jgi:hypothetical protein